jgi:hypothetical protein
LERQRQFLRLLAFETPVDPGEKGYPLGYYDPNR